MRLETLLYTTGIDEYYSSFDRPMINRTYSKESDVARIAYWSSLTVAGLRNYAADSNGHLPGLKADTKLSCIAIQYGTHSLMVSCWTFLIDAVVKDYGEAAIGHFLKDGNRLTEALLTRHFAMYGESLPPSINLLAKKSYLIRLRRTAARK